MTADFLDPTLTERRYSARPRISAPSIHLCSVVATFVSNGDAQRVRSLRPTRPPLHLFALGAASAATSFKLAPRDDDAALFGHVLPRHRSDVRNVPARSRKCLDHRDHHDDKKTQMDERLNDGPEENQYRPQRRDRTKNIENHSRDDVK